MVSRPSVDAPSPVAGTSKDSDFAVHHAVSGVLGGTVGLVMQCTAGGLKILAATTGSSYIVLKLGSRRAPKSTEAQKELK